MLRAQRSALFGAVLGLFLALAQVSSAAKYQRAVMLVVDGLHPVDLSYWASTYPNMMALMKNATVYNNMFVDGLTDTYPASVALYAGGIAACGVLYSPTYDRAVYAADACKDGMPVPGATLGAEVSWSQDSDLNPNALDGGGGANSSAYPFDSKCRKLTPFTYMRCNTIFEVVKKSGGYTAFSEKEVAPFTFLHGPSGNGVSDLYSIEFNSLDSFPPYSAASPGKNNMGKEVDRAALFDAEHMKAVVNWANGKSGDGKKTIVTGAPKLFGASFQSLNVAQKYTGANRPDLVAGYLVDAMGMVTPNTGIKYALKNLDVQLGMLVAALKAKGIYDSTLIAIGGKHGQSPINVAQLRKPTSAPLTAALEAAGIKVQYLLHGTSVVLWLVNRTQTSAAVKVINTLSNTPCDTTSSTCWSGVVQKVLYSYGLSTLGYVRDDPRAPDIIINTTQGVMVDGSKTKISDHGGLSKDDTQVSWMFAGGKMKAATISTRTSTKQVPATIVELLGIPATKLKAVEKEGTKSLLGM